MNQLVIDDVRIKALVVDDEPLARKRLLDLLDRDAGVADTREAENGSVAVRLIRNLSPNLVFLDVQMPEMDGFSVIEAIGLDQMPLTIFVTAYDQYAIQAFEADAIDYLVKPYTDKRFAQALERAKMRLKTAQAAHFGPNFLPFLRNRMMPGAYWDRLVVKSAGLTRFIKATEIDWIEAAGVYVNLHVRGKEILYRAALRELVDRLDPSRFVRIHRSSIVNIESIDTLEPISHGEFEIVLKEGSRLHLSRSFRGELERRLGQTL